MHRRHSERDGSGAGFFREGVESVTCADESVKASAPTAGFSWHRRLRFIQRRTSWYPTWLGLFCVALFLAAPPVWWFCFGESFLSLTDSQPAEVLVVEGWIGRDGVRAAANEFEKQSYKYVVASGGMTTAERWEEAGWSYAEGAKHALVRLGVPETRIIVATASDTERQRTFASAIAVARALQANGIHPKSLNVFTWGPHARRSRLVFAKVFQPGTKVGVVSWIPASYRNAPWWRSSDRAKELLTEIVGYLYEAFFNSGRSSNSPNKDTIPVLPSPAHPE
jgi:uncharacterized SAM-binding protein YcdF (DUF218 family)